MTCSERQGQIFLYAADQLEPAETEELHRHLATGCPTCAGYLAEAEATLAQMSMALDPVEPSAETRDQLMARIIGTKTEMAQYPRLAPAPSRGDGAQEPEDPAKPRGLNEALVARPSRFRIFTTSLLSAAAAIVITSGIFLYATRAQRQFFGSTNLQTVALTSDVQPGAGGQVLWDRDHGQWRVSVFNLSAPAAGKEYELWFIPPGGKPMRSKTFNVDQNGKASVIVSVPESLGPIAMAAITDEPLGGVDAPTGKIQLLGKVQ